MTYLFHHWIRRQTINWTKVTYCQLDPKEQTSVKFEPKRKGFHSRKCIWKCRLQMMAHFVRGFKHMTVAIDNCSCNQMRVAQVAPVNNINEKLYWVHFSAVGRISGTPSIWMIKLIIKILQILLHRNVWNSVIDVAIWCVRITPLCFRKRRPGAGTVNGTAFRRQTNGIVGPLAATPATRRRPRGKANLGHHLGIGWDRWLGARLWYLQCVSTEDTRVFR